MCGEEEQDGEPCSADRHGATGPLVSPREASALDRPRAQWRARLRRWCGPPPRSRGRDPRSCHRWPTRLRLALGAAEGDADPRRVAGTDRAAGGARGKRHRSAHLATAGQDPLPLLPGRRAAGQDGALLPDGAGGREPRPARPRVRRGCRRTRPCSGCPTRTRCAWSRSPASSSVVERADRVPQPQPPRSAARPTEQAPSGSLLVVPLRLDAEIQPGDDLAAAILTTLDARGGTLETGDILVVAQKVVSKAEGQKRRPGAHRAHPLARTWAASWGKDPRHRSRLA